MRSSQPPQPSQTSQTSATASDVSKQVDEALERQRAITGQLNEQIADVKAQISQHQLQQQETITTRPSSLRWNLVPDEHIISPRRSRQRGMSFKVSKRRRSPSRQTLPLIDAAFSGPVVASSGSDSTFSDRRHTVTSSRAPDSSLTTGQVLPPLTSTQYYPDLNVQGPNVSVAGTAATFTGLEGALTPSIQATATLDTHNYPAYADSGASPGFLGPRSSGQILPLTNTQQNYSGFSAPGTTYTGPGMPVASSRVVWP